MNANTTSLHCVGFMWAFCMPSLPWLRWVGGADGRTGRKVPHILLFQRYAFFDDQIDFKETAGT